MSTFSVIRERTTSLWQRALLGGIVALIINLLIYAVATLASVELVIPAQPGNDQLMALPLFAIVVASLVPAFAAAGLYWLLQRFVSRPALVLRVLALLIFLFSLVPVFTTGIPGSAAIFLLLMHIATAATIITALVGLTGE